VDNQQNQEPSASEVLIDNLTHALLEWEKSKREERRWQTVKRIGVAIAATTFGLIYLAGLAPNLFSTEATEPTVAIIDVVGGIESNAAASARKLVPVIERACEARTTKAIILRINSPGGSPTEAERIMAAIERCKTEHPDLPVDAVVEGTGASAGYMIATAADKIIANRYAIVVSIGAVLSGLDASGAAERLGVSERVIASGPLKATNYLFTENTPAQNRALQEVVDGMAGEFRRQVEKARGDRLDANFPDLWSGRIWTAEIAQQAGLIDQVAVMEDYLKASYPELKVHNYRPRQSMQERLGIEASIRDGVTAAVEGWLSPTMQ